MPAVAGVQRPGVLPPGAALNELSVWTKEWGKVTTVPLPARAGAGPLAFPAGRRCASAAAPYTTRCPTLSETVTAASIPGEKSR
jgi:hypothetical protein